MNDKMNSLGQRLKPVRSLWIGLTETLAMLPVPLLAAAFLLPEPASLVWIAILPLLYWLGERSTVRMTRIRLIYRLLLAGGYSFAAAWLLFGSVPGIIAAGLIGAVFVYRGTAPLAPNDANQMRELLLPAVIVYFLASAIGLRFEPFDDFRALLAIGGGATILLLIVRSNKLALIDANYSGRSDRSVPRSVLLRNRIMIGSFIAVLAFIAAFRFLEAMWHEVRSWLQALLGWLASRKPEEAPAQQPEETAAPQEPMFPTEIGEPNALLKLLETIMMTAITVILCVAAIYGLYLVIRRIPAVAKLIAGWLAAWRGRSRDEDAKGYEDEVESLAPLEGWSGKLVRRVSGWFGGESWSKLSEGEKIRYLYRKKFQEAAKKGYAYRSALTPHENTEALNLLQPASSEMNREMTSIYEEVRYGGRQVSKEEANRMKSRWGL